MGFIADLFGGGKKESAPPAPAPLPVAPTPDDAQAKADDTIKKKKAAVQTSGQSVYSNPLGIQGQADVNKKVLLGQ